jgi:hypothetical protein
MAIAYNTSIVRSGLVLHLDAANRKSYPGTGTAWNDLSGNGNNATLVNSPTFNASGYFTFNGTNNYATLSNTLAIAQSIYSSTVEIIAYRNTTTNFEVMFGGGTQSLNSGFYFGFRSSTNNFMYAFYGNDQDGTTPTTNVAWNSYTATYNVAQSSRYRYFNSVLLSPSQSSGVTNSSSSNFAIGAYQTSPGVISNYFAGRIAVVRVYNRELTSLEIQQNFNATRGRYGI